MPIWLKLFPASEMEGGFVLKNEQTIVFCLNAVKEIDADFLRHPDFVKSRPLGLLYLRALAPKAFEDGQPILDLYHHKWKLTTSGWGFLLYVLKPEDAAFVKYLKDYGDSANGFDDIPPNWGDLVMKIEELIEFRNTTKRFL